MDDLQLLLELYAPNPRQGPGSEAMTLRALQLAGLLGRPDLRIADLGCGTGASALVLAQQLDAHITAVDQLPAFLDVLSQRARAQGLDGRITPLAASFDALPIAPGTLDAVWSEGAIYHLGFEAGLAAWRPLLKPGGVIAVSEITWLTAQRPPELQAWWTGIYPQIDLASAKLAALERQGFTPRGYFPLPASCWLDEYYAPLQARLPALRAQHALAPAALDFFAAVDDEIAQYERHQAHYGYGFYIGEKVGD